MPADPGSLGALVFDNSFVRELPGDPLTTNRTRQVRSACWSRVRPTPVCSPEVLSTSSEVVSLLGLDDAAARSPQFRDTFSGNLVLDGMDPFAMCYGGHQFGNWAGQLGDGRAINLGEVIAPDQSRWTLQLKGAGTTPYSRSGDGLAVLRSSVREYLCSEAMYHLGVPTTRALSLVTTGESVMRDMFYDGRAAPEPGAIVCRVAPSFTRFGNFEILAARGETDLLKTLVEYTMRTSFPHLGPPTLEAQGRWFDEICVSTARMIVDWMRVGFVHGVMNTDNMSILGLTIDYGPYGWLEGFEPGWTPNTTDAGGRRYAFGNQPQIGLWNLARLAHALSLIIPDTDLLESGLGHYASVFELDSRIMQARKLGLEPLEGAADTELLADLHEILQMVETDMTIFYRRLSQVGDGPVDGIDDATLLAPLVDAFYQPVDMASDHGQRLCRWLRRYLERTSSDGIPWGDRRDRMNRVNPKYVLRNAMAQVAIDKAQQGDPSVIGELLDVLRRPYDDQPSRDHWAARRPEWARHRAGCSMLSCSS